MYDITKGLFNISEELYVKSKAQLDSKGIDYSVDGGKSGMIYLVVRDSRNHTGHPISFVEKLFGQKSTIAHC